MMQEVHTIVIVNPKLFQSYLASHIFSHMPYNDKMNSVVVDINGEIAKKSDGSDFTAEDINIMKNFKMKPSERKYPVFMFSSTGEKTEYYMRMFFLCLEMDYGIGYQDLLHLIMS